MSLCTDSNFPAVFGSCHPRCSISQLERPREPFDSLGASVGQSDVRWLIPVSFGWGAKVVVGDLLRDDDEVVHLCHAWTWPVGASRSAIKRSAYSRQISTKE
jgi:hypothetical protein